MEIYRSPYEAYPFLSEDSNDLRCDFEILTDKIASEVGLLRSKVTDRNLQDDLLWINELIYHLNPSLRQSLKITDTEIKKLLFLTESLKKKYASSFKFLIPQGDERACLAHILRTETKEVARMVYKFIYQGNHVNSKVIDIINLLSGYFFYLALKFNQDSGIEELEFKSRNYE